MNPKLIFSGQEKGKIAIQKLIFLKKSFIMPT